MTSKFYDLYKSVMESTSNSHLAKKLVNFINDHSGCRAYYNSSEDRIYAYGSVVDTKTKESSEELTILPVNIKAVKEWLGY